MRLLTGKDISSILRSLEKKDATRLLKLLSSGLASYTAENNSTDQERSIHQPLRTVIQTRDGNTNLIMPVSNTSATSVKVATVPNKGDIKGAITIYNPPGELQGVLNAAEITAFRTALASMTIMTRWAAPSKVELVVFGAGKQAEWHVRLALLLISGIQKICVINRGRQRLKDFNQNVLSALRQAHPNVQLNTLAQEGDQDYSAKLRQFLADADIICGCTPSREPLFTSSDLQSKDSSKRKFITLIGSYKPEMQEIDTSTLKSASQVYVDSKEACLEEAGELIRAKMGPDDLIEIGELFSQDPEGKTKLGAESALTIFKCVGMGMMDLVISKALLDMAEDLGIGTVLQDFE